MAHLLGPDLVLAKSLSTGNVTQDFGLANAGVSSLEPAMWHTSQKAYWVPFPGGLFALHFHPGIDRSAPSGTNIHAMEDGVVRFAGWKDSIAGYQVEVEINEQASYSVNHLSKVLCRVGQKVAKGSTIGLVGSTGSSTGPHTHEGVSIRERGVDGLVRTMLYDPALFQKGGALANDPRVKPLERYVRVNGAGINIRHADHYLLDRGSVFAITKADGIYRVGTGKRLSTLAYRFRFLHWRESEIGTFAVVTGYSRRLAIAKSLCHFT